MKRRIAGYILLAVGIATMVRSYQYGLGQIHVPGPGFFPMGLGIMLTVFAAIYTFAPTKVRESSTAWAWGRPAAAMATAIAYTAVLERLGYIIATVLMLLVFVGVVEKQKLLRTVLVAVLGTLAMYVVFGIWLKIPLPAGLLNIRI